MNDFSQFQFLHPAWLILLPFSWWLIRVYCRHARRQSMWNRICDPHLLDNMMIKRAGWDNGRLLSWFLSIVISLAILGAAGPSWRKQSYPLMESTSARVVALDLSQSMLVEDVRPNRFEHAVAVIREMLAAEFDGETALVVFAGSAFVVAPLTRDAKTLLAFLAALDPTTMPEDGNRLDLAIDTAQGLLEASFTGSGQILIVSAGAGDDSAALQSASNAAAKGQRVSVLAIGSPQGGPMLDAEGRLLRDLQGKVILSRTNFKLLEQVARLGKGSMHGLKENPGYTDLLVSRLAAKQLIEAERGQDNSERAAANDAAWFILLLLPFALLLFRKNLIWVLLLGLLLPHEHELQASESAGFWNHPERLAFEAYQRGDYQTAQALAASRQLRAAAYYRSGQYQQALDLYAEGSSAGSSYNRGNALAQLGRLAEAVIAYQEALLLNPELSLAKYNKRLLELFLQQQSAAEKLSADSSGSENASEDQSPDSTEARIGVAGAETNPGDTPELGPGLGASMQIGQVDPFERFDGREQESERFVLRAQADAEALDQQFIEQWINSLPETSTDLFRRKFLRDYRRQKQLR